MVRPSRAVSWLDAHIAQTISTPTPETDDARPCCLACTTPSTHMRRDTSGTRHHSCAAHQTELELYVINANDWDTP